MTPPAWWNEFVGSLRLQKRSMGNVLDLIATSIIDKEKHALKRVQTMPPVITLLQVFVFAFLCYDDFNIIMITIQKFNQGERSERYNFLAIIVLQTFKLIEESNS